MMDVWHKSAFFTPYFHPLSPLKVQHLVHFIRLLMQLQKREMTLISDRNAVLFLFFYFFCGPIDKRWDLFHCYQIGTLTSEHPRWEMHWRWAFLSETACFYNSFLIHKLFFFPLSLSFLCCEMLHFGDTNPAIAHRLTIRLLFSFFL